MNLLDYLQILRRHRLLIIAVVVFGLAVGFLSAPGSDAQPTRYQATHTLILESNQVARNVNLAQAALLVTRGAVPDRVAQQLGGDPNALAAQVEATANPEVGSLEVTATAGQPEQAVVLADTFAQGLLDVLAGDGGADISRTRESQVATVAELQAELSAINEQIADAEAAGEDPAELIASRDGLASEYRLAVGTLAQIEMEAAPASNLRSLESATARAVDEGLPLVESRVGRMAVLGLVGLALGIGLAVFLERVDTRVRSKEDADEAFGLPVMAEIPELPRASRRRSDLMTLTAPVSPYVEAHRSLRTVLLFNGEIRDAAAGDVASQPPQAIMVVSPGPSEGKTSTVAHLAATFAELGKTVLVLSADFRRPRVHSYFGVPASPGLSDVALDEEARQLIEGVHKTTVEGVRLVASGSPIDNPSHLLTLTQRLMDAARDLVDIVLVDTPPLLVVNDATELISHADAVLVVARAGKTSRAAAKRSMEMLRLVEAPLVGTALVGVSGASTDAYYRSQYYSRDRSGPPGLAARWLVRIGRSPERNLATEDASSAVGDRPLSSNGSSAVGEQQPPLASENGSRADIPQKAATTKKR